MDGSNQTKVWTAWFNITAVRVTALAVDQQSGWLYWFQGKTVNFSKLDGQKAAMLIRLAERVRQLRAAGDHVFWLSNSSRQLFSCRKLNANGLKRHEMESSEAGRFDNFYVLHSNNWPETGINPCGGQLCSHICVPTPTAYMRCLCPHGLELLLNGRTCERPRRERETGTSIVLSAETVATKMKNCEEDHFPCLSSSQCIHSTLVCNGERNCDDFSDEGPRKQPHSISLSSQACQTLLFSQQVAMNPADQTITVPITASGHPSARFASVRWTTSWKTTPRHAPNHLAARQVDVISTFELYVRLKSIKNYVLYRV